MKMKMKKPFPSTMYVSTGKPTLTFFRQAFLDLWFVAKVYYCTQYIRQWMYRHSIVLHYMSCPTDFVHSADKNVYCFAKW